MVSFDRHPVYQPTARECAVLVLYLLQTAERLRRPGQKVTRAKIAELSLRRMFGRMRITSEFLEQVDEFLIQRGWTLFFAGSIYGLIRTDSVRGWNNVSYRDIFREVREVERNQLDFGRLEQLLKSEDQIGEESEGGNDTAK